MIPWNTWSLGVTIGSRRGILQFDPWGLRADVFRAAIGIWEDRLQIVGGYLLLSSGPFVREIAELERVACCKKLVSQTLAGFSKV